MRTKKRNWRSYYYCQRVSYSRGNDKSRIEPESSVEFGRDGKFKVDRVRPLKLFFKWLPVCTLSRHTRTRKFLEKKLPGTAILSKSYSLVSKDIIKYQQQQRKKIVAIWKASILDLF